LLQVTNQRDESLRSRVSTGKVLEVGDFTAGLSQGVSGITGAVSSSGGGIIDSAMSYFFKKHEKKESASDRDRMRRDRSLGAE
jgi:hypothetical protein